MPDFPVHTRFTAKDGVSPVLGKMQRGMRQLMSTAKMYGGMAAAMGAGMVVKEFIDFDHAITKASAKFPDLNRNTAEGQKTLKELGDIAKKVGIETQFSAADAAKGLDFLAMAGFNAKQSIALLPGVANLAVVADMDLARASDIASDAIGAFGLMTNNTAQLSKNFTRIQDVMAKTITLTNTNMEDLFETIKYGAPPFTAAGQSMETFNAIAGRMASSGIKASNSGTALRSAIVRLQAPTKDVEKGLTAYGLTQQDLIVQEGERKGKLKDMVEILYMLEKGGKKLTTVEKNAALARIVGKNALSAWSAVLTEGVKNTADLKEELLKSAGASKKMADIINTSLLNQLKGLWSAIVGVGIEFFNAFSKEGSDGIKSLTQGIRDLQPVFVALGKGVSFLAGWMPTLIKLFIAYKFVVLATAAAQKAMAAAEFLRWFMLWGKSIGFTTVAQWKLNAALSANPIGLVITAVGVLIYLFMELTEYSGGFGNALKNLSMGPLRTLIIMLEKLLWLYSKIPVIGKYLDPVVEKLNNLQSNMVIVNGKKNAPELDYKAPSGAGGSTLTGNINVNGLPSGSTVSSQSSGPAKINMQAVGQY